MKVLVTGANGLLGQNLVGSLVTNGVNVVATGRGSMRLPVKPFGHFKYYEADVVDDLAIRKIFEVEKPDVLVHAAAMTQIDECEQNQEDCSAVNVRATEQLLRVAEKYNAFFLFVSTDFVFDGKKGNYREEDPVSPVSWYGHTKVLAERFVAASNISWAIVRTCLVFGNIREGMRSNIISWVKDSLSQGKEINVVNDQFRTPTYVGDLAKGIFDVIRLKANGIFHLSGKDVLTPYEMALATARYYQLNAGLVNQVDASVFTQPAKRPPRTGLDISKARRLLGYEPLSFVEGLERVGDGSEWGMVNGQWEENYG
ncbi:MAG: SDR family oxidoreductase [Chitinophagaceae bacterium]